MSRPGFDRKASTRERSRSRFLFGLGLAAGMLLAGCASLGHWGPGIAALPAAEGWRPLPIGAWVLNDGVAVEAMAFCPRESCARQGFAALMRFEGEQAGTMARALAGDPARLARAFAERPRTAKAGKPSARKTSVRKSATFVSRFPVAGADGLLVELRALAPAAGGGAKSAHGAIVHGRDAQGRLAIAFAVAPEPGAARADALAAWASR